MATPPPDPTAISNRIKAFLTIYIKLNRDRDEFDNQYKAVRADLHHLYTLHYTENDKYIIALNSINAQILKYTYIANKDSVLTEPVSRTIADYTSPDKIVYPVLEFKDVNGKLRLYLNLKFKTTSKDVEKLHSVAIEYPYEKAKGGKKNKSKKNKRVKRGRTRRHRKTKMRK